LRLGFRRVAYKARGGQLLGEGRAGLDFAALKYGLFQRSSTHNLRLRYLRRWRDP
jgi:hypothetical protein